MERKRILSSLLRQVSDAAKKQVISADERARIKDILIAGELQEARTRLDGASSPRGNPHDTSRSSPPTTPRLPTTSAAVPMSSSLADAAAAVAEGRPPMPVPGCSRADAAQIVAAAAAAAGHMLKSGDQVRICFSLDKSRRCQIVPRKLCPLNSASIRTYFGLDIRDSRFILLSQLHS